MLAPFVRIVQYSCVFTSSSLNVPFPQSPSSILHPLSSEITGMTPIYNLGYCLIFQSCASLSGVINYLVHRTQDLGSNSKPIENLIITRFRLLRLNSIGLDNFSGSFLRKGQGILFFPLLVYLNMIG